MPSVSLSISLNVEITYQASSMTNFLYYGQLQIAISPWIWPRGQTKGEGSAEHTPQRAARGSAREQLSVLFKNGTSQGCQV